MYMEATIYYVRCCVHHREVVISCSRQKVVILDDRLWMKKLKLQHQTILATLVALGEPSCGGHAKGAVELAMGFTIGDLLCK
jgi:hypothetical protein